jgi:hypothetical protein
MSSLRTDDDTWDIATSVGDDSFSTFFTAQKL